MKRGASMDRRRLRAARRILEHVGMQLDAHFSVRLWDGSIVPLGPRATSRHLLTLSGPEVLGSLLRRPTLPNLLEHYAAERLDVRGSSLISFGDQLRAGGSRLRFRDLSKTLLLREALPLLMTRRPPRPRRAALGAQRSDIEAIRFHYDLSNDFYRLFLDPEMQYSCAYFEDWNDSLEQAQLAKLDVSCRRLRLQPGERLLDVGCGWGGLICHAALHHGVLAHGVTLSKEQFEFASVKIKQLGLTGRVSVELCDYSELGGELRGEFDKIASIEMYEHVGIDRHPAYFDKLCSLLRDRGLMLIQGTTRRAKGSRRAFDRVRPERQWMLEQVFPESELDHIGHTLSRMEEHGFEVHDVESWRRHFAQTTRIWSERLWTNRERAASLVGSERYRVWLAYLAGVSYAFSDGSLRAYQILASKHAAKGPSELPPTRADLYAHS